MLPESFSTEFLHRLELLRLRSRRSFLGTRQGGHISLKKGHGIEFSDFRQYELGDDPRHIDWGVFARSDRLYVKRFQEEQNLSVLLILDGSASMRVPATDRKWEMARDVVLALAYISLMQQDRVTVAVPGQWLSPAYSGGAAIHQLSRELLRFTFRPEQEFSSGVQAAAARVRFPGVAVVVSDFLMPLPEIQKAFYLLRAKNLDVHAVQLLGAEDLKPLPDSVSAIAVDSETGEEVELELNATLREDYAHYLNEHNRALRQFLAESNIPCTVTSTAEGVQSFMLNNLTATGLVS